MKTLQKIVTVCCLALFVASVTACSGGPGEVKKTDDDKMNLPPAAAGTANPDDPNSGTNASFE